MGDRPYDEDAILPYEVVQTFPAVTIDPRALIPTQEFAVIDRLVSLANGGVQEGPDPCPHVVSYAGGLYVHNGHHRWLRALFWGREIDVRIVEVQ